MHFSRKRPLDFLGYILAESSNGKAVGKIRNYLNKWKPLRQALPGVAVELEALGTGARAKVRQGPGGFLPGCNCWAARANRKITPRSCENCQASKNLRRRLKKKRNRKSQRKREVRFRSGDRSPRRAPPVQARHRRDAGGVRKRSRPRNPDSGDRRRAKPAPKAKPEEKSASRKKK